MVYIDNMNAPFGDMIMCHMIADSSEELLAMADKIGVKRKWIQYPGTEYEHFDICLTKKKKAITAGAKEITMLELGYMRRSIHGPEAVESASKQMNVAQLSIFVNENPDFKSNEDITVRVNEVLYKVPSYCLVDVLWGMPDDFYPCDKYEWADHPLYFTSIEMLREAIISNEGKFKAFICRPITG